MKWSLAACLVAALVWGAAPRLQGEESKEQLRDKKLQEEFFKKATWFTDYDKVRAEAKKSDKIIFAYFTRSYAY